LLLNTIKFTLLAVILSISTGCVKKTYSSGYYNNKSYKKIPKEKIRNSKAMHRATMKAYTVLGKRYYPTKARVGDTFRGVASWYGPDFHAKKTSNGEIYNMYAMTAAHKTLPMNTMVKVHNLDNGKTTIVRINDRGPFVTGRIIDLSNKAAHHIGMVKKGTARIKLTILGFNAKIAQTKSERQVIKTTSSYLVQVGAFSKIAGAKSIKRKFELILEDEYKAIIRQNFINGKKINRVFISGFRSENEASDFKKNNNLENATIIAD